jgi:hypothetical protein
MESLKVAVRLVVRSCRSRPVCLGRAREHSASSLIPFFVLHSYLVADSVFRLVLLFDC